MNNLCITVFGDDCIATQWWSLLNHSQGETLAFCAEQKAAGKVMQVQYIDERLPMVVRQESRVFRDMTYAACRGRYDATRTSILESISDGRVSSSMSGIENYFAAWDDAEPSDWEDLRSSLTWNGVFHVKVDAEALMQAFHPKAIAAVKGADHDE